jgi:hypothetical protein
LNDAKTDTENQLRPGRVETQDATTQSKLAEALSQTATANLTDAKTDTENQLRPGALTQQSATTAKTNAETAKLEAETQLTQAKTRTQNRVTLPAGHTLVYTDENGEQQTFTAPDTQVVTLSPGEQATVIKPDQTREVIEGPPASASADPKDGTDRLANVDQQLDIFMGPEATAFANTDGAVLRRIRANITKAVKGKSTEEAGVMIQDLLSQTFNGMSEYEVTTGRNFSVPAFVVNQIRSAPTTPSAEAVASMYGISKDQAERLIAEVRQ